MSGGCVRLLFPCVALLVFGGGNGDAAVMPGGPSLINRIGTNEPEKGKITIQMPNVVPEKDDHYICTVMRLNLTDIYVTSFEVQSSMDVAHHIVLSWCNDPTHKEKTWECTNRSINKRMHMCNDKVTNVYKWARNAPRLDLPEGVGFKVGNPSKPPYLVLQIHYASADLFKDGRKDDSGVVMEYTKIPQPKHAAIYLMSSNGRIYPHQTEYWDSACTFESDMNLHPFAFRPHTHSLGRVVSAYKVEKDGEEERWILIGKKDPLLPQMFYPLANQMTFSKGDSIAMRCTYKSNRDHITYAGATHNDEMCVAYIMYWKYANDTDPPPPKCRSPGPPEYYLTNTFKNVPADISFLPVQEM